MEIIFYKPSPSRLFLNVYCLARIIFLVLTFPGLRIEALPLSTVQGKCKSGESGNSISALMYQT